MPYIRVMERIVISEDLEATLENGRVGLHGELRHDNALLFLTWLGGIGSVTQLWLDELDIDDGIAATEAVNAIRSLLAKQPLLSIHGAPQVLAHNLYRTGLLSEGRIHLEAMREDEAYG